VRRAECVYCPMVTLFTSDECARPYDCWGLKVARHPICNGSRIKPVAGTEPHA
jgi:hypothetical protein